MTVQDRTSLRSAYLYLVCLVTLVIGIFAAVSTVRNTVGLLYPDPGLSAFEPVYGPEGRDRLSDEERAEREEAFEEAERRRAVLDLVGAGTMLLIAGPAYLYHWRRVQAERAPVRRPADEAAGS
ncbi:MAG TPA: hypothetical protein VNU66_10400 [Mycobacteriales bacterium]|nr:hypothetical protein [Mycobacteriales bacterium]